MFNSLPVSHIAFHDDVDGIVSAAVFLKAGFRNPIYRLYPVSSSMRGKNFQSLVESMNLEEKDELVVLDYEHHPRANIWFDHHYSPDFGQEPVSNKSIRYNPNKLSAASMIIEEYSKSYQFPKSISDSVDMVDSAGYSDPKLIFNDESPIMILRAYLEKIIPHDMSYCRIVEILNECNLDIDAALYVMKIDKSYVKIIRDEAFKAKEHLVVNNNMSILRQRRPNQFPRYCEYLIIPNIKYCIRLTKVDGQNVYFQIMCNKWHVTPNEINIGKSLSKIKFLNKAGGHFHVGGGVVKEDDVEKLLDELCYLFNKEEPMEKYGVDKEDPVEKQASEMVKTGSEASIDSARASVIEKKKGELETNAGDKEQL